MTSGELVRAAVEAGAIFRVPDARTYRVRGRRGSRYLVTLDAFDRDAPRRDACTCPAVGPCWHIDAAHAAEVGT